MGADDSHYHSTGVCFAPLSRWSFLHGFPILWAQNSRPKLVFQNVQSPLDCQRQLFFSSYTDPAKSTLDTSRIRMEKVQAQDSNVTESSTLRQSQSICRPACSSKPEMAHLTETLRTRDWVTNAAIGALYVLHVLACSKKMQHHRKTTKSVMWDT